MSAEKRRKPRVSAESTKDAAKPNMRRSTSLWAKLGVPPPEFLNEDLAPKVDEILLRRLVRRELSSGDAQRLYELISSFRSWNDAYIRVSVSDYRSSTDNG